MATEPPADELPTPWVEEPGGVNVWFMCHRVGPTGIAQAPKRARLNDLSALLAALTPSQRESVLGPYLKDARKSERTAWSGALHNAMPDGFVELDTAKIIPRVAALLTSERSARAEAERMLAIGAHQMQIAADDYVSLDESFRAMLVRATEAEREREEARATLAKAIDVIDEYEAQWGGDYLAEKWGLREEAADVRRLATASPPSAPLPRSRECGGASSEKPGSP